MRTSGWIRPSKLRFPDSTAHTARCPARHRLGDTVEKRAGVADAGGAAVADEVEAERGEGLGESGALEVVGDDPRSRCQRGLHPGFRSQSPLDGPLGEKAGADHHLGVRGVGAARDGGDDDVAVVDDHVVASRLGGHRAPDPHEFG